MPYRFDIQNYNSARQKLNESILAVLDSFRIQQGADPSDDLSVGLIDKLVVTSLLDCKFDWKYQLNPCELNPYSDLSFFDTSAERGRTFFRHYPYLNK